MKVLISKVAYSLIYLQVLGGFVALADSLTAVVALIGEFRVVLALKDLIRHLSSLPKVTVLQWFA